MILFPEVLAYRNTEITAESLQIALFHKPAIRGPDESFGYSEFASGDLMGQFPVISENHPFIKASKIVKYGSPDQDEHTRRNGSRVFRS